MSVDHTPGKDTPAAVTVGPYIIRQELEDGQYYRTCLATHRTNSTLHTVKAVALKQLRANSKLQLQIEREVTVLRNLPHPHLVQLDDVLYSQTHLFVITRYCEGGELFEALEEANSRVSAKGGDPGLLLSIVKRLGKELLTAVHFLHTQGIAHRDIKLEHVFLDEDNHVRLGGFSMAAAMEQPRRRVQGGSDTVPLTVCCGSKHYACPEVVDGVEYDGRAADAWSCGVLLFAIATGSLPFVEDETKSDDHLFQAIRRGDVVIANHPAWGSRFAVNHPLRSLVTDLLNPNPSLRASVANAIEHPFFSTEARAEASPPPRPQQRTATR